VRDIWRYSRIRKHNKMLGFGRWPLSLEVLASRFVQINEQARERDDLRNTRRHWWASGRASLAKAASAKSSD
jgi:hypothetical protein